MECGSEFRTAEPHPDEGNAQEYLDIHEANGITVLAEGECAQGAAGRMGGHPEYLVILEPGSTLRVERFGRLYGDTPISYLHWDGESLRFGEPDEVFPPTDEAEEGEMI